MDEQIKNLQFNRLIKKKFDVYNSLIQNLSYDQVEHVGMLLPIIASHAREGLDAGLDPESILQDFFKKHTSLHTDQSQIDFLFKVIQYVERQVVLYDSVEDAAFSEMQDYKKTFSIRDFFQLIEGEKNWDKLRKKVNRFRARIVLTAHPTQFYSTSVLNIIGQLREKIRINDLAEIDLMLQQLGMTSLVNAKNPSPLEEARNIIYLMRHVYYDAIGDFHDSIRRNLHELHFDNPGLLELGFWPGGDRDGNPYVTAEITLAVADELRMTLMKCYYRDIKTLQDKLSFRHISPLIKELKDLIYDCMFDVSRVLTAEEILSRLVEIRGLLVADYFSLYLEELDRLIQRVRIFRTHFASLDIRQDDSVHRKVVTAVLKKANRIVNDLEELTPQELEKLLVKEYFAIDPDDFPDDLIRDTLVNMQNIRTIRSKNGPEACHRYIISNSEDTTSVLFVYALFRWCGWKPEDLGIEIVPLFETMKGMSVAGDVMNSLFALPEYREHVARLDNRQTIMLGFSDGTKDGGYLKANWSIFKTKECLSALCERQGIQAIFFDGRGGPPARGGGKTHRFYAAQTPEIADHEIHLTIQGQTITSKYGTKEQFIFHSEQLVTAALFKHFFGAQNRMKPEERDLIENLSEISFRKYTQLKEHPQFLPYLEKKSTLRYYGRTRIGSRPGKRGKSDSLSLSDLRAISFVGSWSQLKQNVPGYYGIGTALSNLAEEGKLDALKDLFHAVPFFKALIMNSMMSMSKSYFALTSYLRDDSEFGSFWKLLHDEFLLAKEMVLKISGYAELMDEEPLTRSSIRIREKIVLPLLLIQQYALQQIEKDPPNREVYEKMVTRSLYGNINASRNSA